MAFMNSGCVPYEVKELNLFLPMYADDMVIYLKLLMAYNLCSMHCMNIPLAGR